MAFQPAPTLRSRTFVGLILAQFLAAFNDQCIHASAMFYAIHHETLTEASAISLMPVLFYAPWAIFCTLAGFLADRYGKRQSLVFWKVAEIGITLVALAGFWLGAVEHKSYGPVVVLSTVFLMGTHSAFFVPAKYGIMPEILEPQLLSKGNGILESTSFLAVILGTVSGGILSDERVFKDREYFIGLVLVGLACLGAAASLLIRRVPAANPGRPFPRNLLKPLAANLRVMARSRPLALSVLGIAFFTFMVAFMRSTMYMHGETRNPRWTEMETSIVVATVALGVGLGSPLAGFLSGGKVELGLVPLGAVGMIVSTALAAYTIGWQAGLIVSLVMIGFCSGFYIVPLYTLLQHRAPKSSKGDLIATSNFINVTGAIVASALFFSLVYLAHRSGITPEVPQEDIARGELLSLKYDKGRPAKFTIETVPHGRFRKKAVQVNPENLDDDEPLEQVVIEVGGRDTGFIELGSGLNPRREGTPGSQVVVSKYVLERAGVKVTHYKLRPADQPTTAEFDEEDLPRYLFLGASVMTLAILLLLCRKLPDFFVRSLLWLRTHGKYSVRVAGLNHLPTEGPVILATNCERFQECLQVVAATDRFTGFILLETRGSPPPRRPLLRFLARRTGVVVLQPGKSGGDQWDQAVAQGAQALHEGHLLGLSVAGPAIDNDGEKLLQDVLGRQPAPVLPVYCGRLAGEPSANGNGGPHPLQVTIGTPLRPDSSIDEIRQAILSLPATVPEHLSGATNRMP